ncbi:unnamed protein product [Darwinula stevensoni]|uniref:TLC domain-containing protein n=1 Tax=Darwinula stevensoni TaxID=69355 RepID=A0A7R9ACB1_9CRUS|nr:unnamed protein product [Darwinula stevensoni]CAG0899870.1 unnamed protein product [Darwinula stevensoni]
MEMDVIEKDAYMIFGLLWILFGVLIFCCFTLLFHHCVPASANHTTRQAWKWKNIATSCTHALITGLGAFLVMYLKPEIAEDLISTYSTPAHALVAISVGYFIVDSVDMYVNNKGRASYELLVHHVFVILCFGLTVVVGYYLGYAIVALICEVNSFFLHIRQLMLIQGVPKETSCYRLNSLINIGSFPLVM